MLELARRHEGRGNIVVYRKRFRDKGRGRFRTGDNPICSKRERHSFDPVE